MLIWASWKAETVKNLPAMQETQVQSLGWEIPWRREWLPTPVFLPGEMSESFVLSCCPSSSHSSSDHMLLICTEIFKRNLT